MRVCVCVGQGRGRGRGSHAEVFGGNERGLDGDSKQKHSELARRLNSTAKRRHHQGGLVAEAGRSMCAHTADQSPDV